ncbi:MAG: hypothetical protein QOI51_2218 [Nocardioidaceae bacterium]|nr:hypothetical protein [Nocardioidaceae bacterium]
MDLPETLDRITAAAREIVPGVDQASISIRHPDGRLQTVAPTDLVVVDADEVQHELKEGPCYDVVTGDVLTYSRDLAEDERWPNYGPKAAALGLGSQLALRLLDGDGARSGLNLYAVRPGAFDEAQEAAALFAAHARVAMAQAQGRQTLIAALTSRDTVGKAIGITMERYRITDEQALQMLVRVSQTNNVKLRDIAADIVAEKIEDARHGS